MTRTLTEGLEEVLDRIEGLREWASDLDVIGAVHKLEEAEGPVNSALEAARQAGV